MYNLTVLLKESLLGFDKTITQLNGEGISVKSTEVVGKFSIFLFFYIILYYHWDLIRLLLN